MELRVCSSCNRKYGYFYSEPADKCPSCGKKLRVLDFNNLQDPYGTSIEWEDRFKDKKD